MAGGDFTISTKKVSTNIGAASWNYTPAIPGDWVTSGAPATIFEAFDKIAAMLGPI